MATADETAADVADMEGPKARLDMSRRVQRLRPGAVREHVGDWLCVWVC